MQKNPGSKEDKIVERRSPEIWAASHGSSNHAGFTRFPALTMAGLMGKKTGWKDGIAAFYHLLRALLD
jgi:hypothetical protein